MGLREAIVTTVILGLTTAAAADAKKPAKAAPASTRKPGADTKAAEATAPAAPAEADAKAEGSDAEKEELPPHIVGPKHVELGNNTSIDLPDGMVLFERAVAQDLMRQADENAERIVGIVFKPESSWHVSIEYVDVGYIEDSDADDLDADDLLDSYRKGTAEQNKIRKSHGNTELQIDGWSEKPRYERPVHHLVWGIAAHSTDGSVVNYFTRVLGRNGFLSLNLIVRPELLDAAKKEAAAVLHAAHFNPGSTYTDHVSSDRSSGIGLRGLVLGGAGVAVASKLGLLAKILIFFKKGFILLAAAIAGLFGKVFRRKRAPADAGNLDASAVAMAPPPTAPPPMTPTPMGGPGDPHDGSSG